MSAVDKQMSEAVKVADSIDSVTPQEWDVLNRTWRPATTYGHLAHPADNISKPRHYTGNGVEAIDYINQQLGGEGIRHYLEGNILKYMHRWRFKNGVEDLRKARWYLDKLIYEEVQGGVDG